MGLATTISVVSASGFFFFSIGLSLYHFSYCYLLSVLFIICIIYFGVVYYLCYLLLVLFIISVIYCWCYLLFVLFIKSILIVIYF